METPKTFDEFKTKIADILASNSVAIEKRMQIYFHLDLKEGNDFTKLSGRAGHDSWEFFREMIDMYFQSVENIDRGIDKLVKALKSDYIGLRRDADAIQKLQIDCKIVYPNCLHFPAKPISELFFNVEPLCSHFTGREPELQTLMDIIKQKSNDKSKIAVLTSIAGIGGIGKTMLARKFAHKFKEECEGNVVWIPCDTYDLAYAAVWEILEDMHIDVKPLNSEKISATKLCKRVYEALAKSETLLIFDNYDEPEASWILKFMPKVASSEKFCVLITSRRQDISGNKNTINLDTFTPSEARDLISLELGNLDDELIYKLAEKLGYFPLAIRIATSNIQRIKSVSQKEAAEN